MGNCAFDTSDSETPVAPESEALLTERDASQTGIGLARVMGELARGLAAKTDLDATLTGITAAVVVAVPGAAYAGIVDAVGRGGMVGKASTDVIVGELDQLQAELQQGPSLAALGPQHRIISIPEMAGEKRWPDFAAAAVRLGVGSMLSLQLFAQDKLLGALNLYATTPHGFIAGDEIIADVFAAHAAIALGDATKRQEFSDAIASRDVIGQAKGILMARHHTTGARAFDMLIAASQQTNIKLVDVARWLVDEHEHLPPDSSPASHTADGARGVR